MSRRGDLTRLPDLSQEPQYLLGGRGETGSLGEEAPAKRITLEPLLVSGGDIYKDEDGWSLPEDDDSGPSSMFLESMKVGAMSILDKLVSRSIENTCALSPFRSFGKKRELVLHTRKYRVATTNYLADTSSHALALAKRIYDGKVSKAILSKEHQ